MYPYIQTEVAVQLYVAGKKINIQSGFELGRYSIKDSDQYLGHFWTANNARWDSLHVQQIRRVKQ